MKHLEKEATSMTAQTINAKLFVNAEGHNLLEFEFASGSKSLDLDDETNESQIKSLFASLLSEMVNSKITIRADIPETREHDLYGEVCKEYIDQLNSEISRIKPRLEALNSSRPATA